MASFNKLIAVGYIGRDAELRYTPKQQAVTDFSLATTERRGEEEMTTWFKVTVWGRQAESLSEYLTKGRQVYVEGRLFLREYEKDGVTKATLEVNADSVRLLGSSPAERGSSERQEKGDWVEPQPRRSAPARGRSASASSGDEPDDTVSGGNGKNRVPF